MKSIPGFLILIALLISGCQSAGDKQQGALEKPNVLLICVDDLRPELNCYGADHIISPHIDALADEGVLFTRAYTQQAVCAPSRNTLMTGIRPDGLGIYDLSTFFRTSAPDVVTLSQHFLQNGYHAEGMGKIYHQGHGNHDDSLSWSIPHWSATSIVRQREPITRGDTTRLHTSFPAIDGKRLPYYNSSLPDLKHRDPLTATHAIERMEALKDQPFFLAVGFVKPHLPFVAHSKYWDLYDPDEIEIPPLDKPDYYPPYAFTNWGELRKYHAVPPEGPLSEADSRGMIHGYYACVSMIDAQVGRLVDKLKELGLYDNTIIVLWGDHGWKLGEYGDWCKHTNYELDTRIPVIVRVPGMDETRGLHSEAVIETVDVYPTLCDLAGLNMPDHLQGSSFKQVLESGDAGWDEVAFSQYRRTSEIDGARTMIMGYSMRNERYRITRWVDRATGETLDTEVYEHLGPTRDPASTKEMVNLASVEEVQTIVDQLNEELEEQYRKEHGTDLTSAVIQNQ